MVEIEQAQKLERELADALTAIAMLGDRHERELAEAMAQLAAAIRERDNAISDWKQADTDSIRALHERNKARAEMDVWKAQYQGAFHVSEIINQRDALADALEKAELFMNHGLTCYARLNIISRVYPCDCGMEAAQLLAKQSLAAVKGCAE